MKNILLILLLITASLFAEINDIRLLRYPEAKQWSKDADVNGESAYNIGVLYQQTIKDDAKAIEWYKKAYKMDNTGASIDAANNLGYIYSEEKKYKEAIKWYKIASDLGDSEATQNLGLL